jgi:hypothetical protein
MPDISNLAPDLAHALGLNPATLVLLIFIVHQGCNLIARAIPNDATGWQGVVRQIAAVVGTYVSNRVTSSASANDILAAAATTPPIPEKVAAASEEEKA